MKKLVLAVIAAMALPTLVLAQGTVVFGSSGPSQNNQFFQYDNLSKAGGITAQLWWSADNIAAYQLAASLTTESALPFTGYLFNNATTVTVTGAAGGSTPWFYVRGTDGGLYAGQSAAFQSAALGNPSAQPPTTAPTLDGWNTPVTLTPIPEPSTIALAGLGVASLLIFRRRK
jgi:hypothetical protein